MCIIFTKTRLAIQNIISVKPQQRFDVILRKITRYNVTEWSLVESNRIIKSGKKIEDIQN